MQKWEWYKFVASVTFDVYQKGEYQPEKEIFTINGKAQNKRRCRSFFSISNASYKPLKYWMNWWSSLSGKTIRVQQVPLFWWQTVLENQSIGLTSPVSVSEKTNQVEQIPRKNDRLFLEKTSFETSSPDKETACVRKNFVCIVHLVSTVNQKDFNTKEQRLNFVQNVYYKDWKFPVHRIVNVSPCSKLVNFLSF